MKLNPVDELTEDCLSALRQAIAEVLVKHEVPRVCGFAVSVVRWKQGLHEVESTAVTPPFNIEVHTTTTQWHQTKCLNEKRMWALIAQQADYAARGTKAGEQS